MLTTDGCRARRQRLLDALKPATPLLLGDPLNLRYLAACHIDAFSLGADFGALLLVEPDGKTTLFYDKRVPSSVERAQVDARVPVAWYDGKSPGVGARRWSLHDVVAQHGGRVHDSFTDPDAAKLWDAAYPIRAVRAAMKCLATFHCTVAAFGVLRSKSQPERGGHSQAVCADRHVHLRPGLHVHGGLPVGHYLHRRRQGASCSIVATPSSSWPPTATTWKPVTCYSTANCPTLTRKKISSAA